MKRPGGLSTRLFLLPPLLLALPLYLYPLAVLYTAHSPLEAIEAASMFLGGAPRGFKDAVVAVDRGCCLVVVVRGPDLGVVANSLLLAATVAVVSTLLGLAHALAAVVYRLPRLAQLFPLLGLVPFPFIQAYVVERLFNPGFGLVNTLLAPLGLRLVVTGLAGVAVYQVLTLYPLAFLLILSYLRRLPGELVEAALGLGAGPATVARTVLAPSARPAIVASLALSAVLSLDDVVGPLVFQADPSARNLLAYQAYTYFLEEVTGTTSPRALGYTLVLASVSLAVFAVAYPSIAGVYAALGRPAYRPPTAPRAPPWLTGLLTVLGLAAATPTLLSCALAFSDTWVASPLPEPGLGHLPRALEPWRLRGLVNTLAYTAAALALALAAGLPAAHYTARRPGPTALLLDALLTSPLAVPGVVVAYSLYWAYHPPLAGTPLDPLENPAPWLIGAYAVRRLPVLYKASQALLAAVPREAEEAALSLGAPPWRTALLATAMVAPGLAAASWYTAVAVETEVSTSITLGGLAGSHGPWHPAPLTYIVYADTSLSGLLAGPASALLTLTAHTTITLTYLAAAKAMRGRRGLD